jgi:hypothetical protein
MQEGTWWRTALLVLAGTVFFYYFPKGRLNGVQSSAAFFLGVVAIYVLALYYQRAEATSAGRFRFSLTTVLLIMTFVAVFMLITVGLR